MTTSQFLTSDSYNRYTALHGLLHVQRVSLDIIEAIYIEKTRGFAWELHKNGQLQLKTMVSVCLFTQV